MKTCTRFLLTVSLVLAMVFTLSCSTSDDESGGSTSCSLNGSTVTIGTQTWMAENLNCDVKGSICYDNDPANCAKYGRLYNLETAMKVCPSGWHLPSDDEWTTLTNYVESQGSCTYCAGTKLKATSGWANNGNGTDDYGFSALPGGRGTNGGYLLAGNEGFWWSSSFSDHTTDRAFARQGYSNGSSLSGANFDKPNELSVRCLKN